MLLAFLIGVACGAVGLVVGLGVAAWVIVRRSFPTLKL